jgi:hypothetical protein
MPSRKKEQSKIFSLANGKLLAETQRSRVEKPTKKTSGKRQTKRRGSRWQPIALVCLAVLLLTTIALALYAFHMVATVRQETHLSMGRMETQIQKLDAGIRFDSKRQQLLLGIRDVIMEANPRIGLNEAYQYSELVLKSSEKYPSLEPLMFLSIGLVESGFDPRAASAADARGLYQIWPSTGRMLARVLGWEYNEQILFEPDKNMELAALYLDILFSAYNDERLVLAEYNGGPLNAGLLRAGSTRAASETRQYVAKVLDTHEGLKRRFEQGLDIKLELMHKDRARNDKRLWVPLPNARFEQTAEAGN